MRVAYDEINGVAHIFDESGYEMATHNWGYSELEEAFGRDSADEIWNRRRQTDEYQAREIAENDFNDRYTEQNVFVEEQSYRDSGQQSNRADRTRTIVHTEDDVDNLRLEAQDVEAERMELEPQLPGLEPAPNRFEEMTAAEFAEEQGFEVEDRWFDDYDNEMLDGDQDVWIDDQTEQIMENWEEYFGEEDMDSYAVDTMEHGGGRPMAEGDDGWGFMELYDKIIPSEVKATLKQLDKKAKVGKYSFEYDNVGAAAGNVTGVENTVHGTLIPITPKMIETVRSKGLKSPY